MTFRVAIVGYGLAVRPVVRSLSDHGFFDVVACADPDPVGRERFAERIGGRCFDSAVEMLKQVTPDAVYIATPTRVHEELALLALSHGCHVLVEKPIALDLASALRMVAAARDADRYLLVNHKRSADREILAMRSAIRSGEVGSPRWIDRWYGTDWMFRPRAEEERDPAFGGVVLRQGAHEFDILRGLMVSPPKRVKAWVGDLVRDRPGEGAYTAWIECEDGSVANSVYSGYDRFLTDELTVGPLPHLTIGASRRQHADNAVAEVDEYELKRTVGHPKASELLKDLYGFSFAMCEDGDVRTAPGRAAWIYGRSGRRTVTVDGPAGTDLIIDELYQAVTTGRPPTHDGAWGLACLELCMAVRRSSESGEFIALEHQTFTEGSSSFSSDERTLVDVHP